MALNDHPIGPIAAVSDLARARAFYEDVLGLQAQETDPEHVITYACGGESSLVVYLSPEHAGRTSANVAVWGVPDVVAEVEDLTARGVTFERYDDMEQDERGIVGAGPMASAFFKDPDGNTLVVVQV